MHIMERPLLQEYSIDYAEIYTPMAQALAYWHVHALGFAVTAYAGMETGQPGISSFVLESGKTRLVLTSAYPTRRTPPAPEIASFLASDYCGVKRIVLAVPSVGEAFARSVAGGAFPVKLPVKMEDELGFVEEAAIKLYDNNEIVFIDRSNYSGAFRPGYKEKKSGGPRNGLMQGFDHIAAEVRINEIDHWTRYLSGALGTQLVQSISRGEENRTGMILNINQSFDKRLTLVMAEPENRAARSKVQQNIDTFGPGIHHLAFSTVDLPGVVRELKSRSIDFIGTPSSYYDILRSKPEFGDLDIDLLEEYGILADKEEDGYLLQKFIKPISDRPFFFYELVERVNGYSGFALKNINILKQAEEREITFKN